MTEAYVEDTDRLGPRPARRRAAGDGDDRGDRRPDRRPGRVRPRLRVGRRRLLPRAQLRSATASSPTATPTTWTRARRRDRGAEGGPARLRAVEGAQGGRGHRLGLALGRGPARLAHRVLGDGRGRARRSTSRSTAAARTSSSPTTRTRSPRPRRPAAAARPDLDAQRDGPDRRREDVEVGGQHLPALRGARPSTGREAVVGYLVSGHYRQPLEFSEAALEEAAARNERIRNFLREVAVRADPTGQEVGASVDERRETFLDALADDFNTPRALAELFELIGEANRRRARRRTGRGGRAAAAARARARSPRPEEAADAEAEELLAERERARAERDFERADRIRDELAERGWEVRDTPQGARLVRSAGGRSSDARRRG